MDSDVARNRTSIRTGLQAPERQGAWGRDEPRCISNQHRLWIEAREFQARHASAAFVLIGRCVKGLRSIFLDLVNRATSYR